MNNGNYQGGRRPVSPEHRRRVAMQRRRARIRAARIRLAIICVLLLIIVAGVVVGVMACVCGGGDEVTTPDTSFPSSESEPESSSPEESTAEETTAPPAASSVEFSADLSAYEQYMNPGTGDDYLILVNTSNTIDETYAPTDLVDVADTRPDRSARKMREYAEKALEAFLIEGRANGVNDVTVTSAYRPYSEQNYLFNNRMAMYSSLTAEEAYAEAAKVVAPPGTSEHQTGLCCDMHNIPTGADTSFGATEQGKWLAENCWKFGFILRYPEDKTDITGIIYEPWHFRYVGRFHAEQMTKLGMCLEEYTEYLKTK